MESFDGYLYAINPEGAQKWRILVGDGGHSCPTIAPDGTILVGSYVDGKLYAIDPAGVLKWSFMLGAQVASAAIGSDGVIYIGSKAGKFFALDSEGYEIWSFPSGEVYMTSCTISKNGMLYVGSHTNDCLYALYSSSNGMAESAWPVFHHDIKHTGRYTPNMTLSFSPEILWPPNKKMVQVSPTISYSNYCNSEPIFELISIGITEGDITCIYDPNFEYSEGDCYTYDDFTIDEYGIIYLRAERLGRKDARIYTITYSASDAYGNYATASSTVKVPHDMR